jgi:hypothetical protein
VVPIPVTAERERRWLNAAATIEADVTDWLIAAIDAGAEEVHGADG